MSVPALRQQIKAIERSGYFGVAQARALVSAPVLGKQISVEEHAVLSLFKDRVEDRRVNSSHQARTVLNRVVLAGPTNALADGAAVAVGAAKKGALFAVIGALAGGAFAAIATAITGHHGPWAHYAAENALIKGMEFGGVMGGAAGVVRGGLAAKQARD